MTVHPVEVSQTAASAAWSFNTEEFKGALLRHIVIKAASTDTTFTITLTDDKSNVVYDSGVATGTLRAEVAIPVRGVYTVATADSSADEAFTGRLSVLEGTNLG